MYKQICVTLLTLIAVFVGGCKHLDVVNEELNLYSESVGTTPVINGTPCDVCVDVTRIGGQEQLRWVTGWRPSQPVPPELNTIAGGTTAIGASLVADVNQKVANCPPNSKIRLQFLYHCDDKPIWQVRNNRTTQIQPRGGTGAWSQRASIEAALATLAAQQPPRFEKIVLSGCLSSDHHQTIASAFAVPGIKYVVTADNTILLECGYIRGAKYPTFERQPVRIDVWKNDAQGRRVRQKPREKVDDDERYNVESGAIETEP